MKIIIVGGEGGTNIGGSFYRAASAQGRQVKLINSQNAFSGSRFLQIINWHFLGHRPANLRRFSFETGTAIEEFSPDCLITTGLAPIEAKVLKKISQGGIKTMCFLTDDPWSRVHRSSWFFQALTCYDVVFSPRKANMADLTRIGCKQVEYLPFGYDQDLFYAESESDSGNAALIESDIAFAGGADSERVPYISALQNAGFDVALYGSYWERFTQTKLLTRGQADIATLRKVLTRAKLCLCLVRRSNRDGNCMRTFEVPAVGSCMLCEDTPEHREIFGDDGKSVVYFRSPEDMVERARWLVSHPVERNRIATSGHQLITNGQHTYADRLRQMLLFI